MNDLPALPGFMGLRRKHHRHEHQPSTPMTTIFSNATPTMTPPTVEAPPFSPPGRTQTHTTLFELALISSCFLLLGSKHLCFSPQRHCPEGSTIGTGCFAGVFAVSYRSLAGSLIAEGMFHDQKVTHADHPLQQTNAEVLSDMSKPKTNAPINIQPVHCSSGSRHQPASQINSQTPVCVCAGLSFCFISSCQG